MSRNNDPAQAEIVSRLGEMLEIASAQARLQQLEYRELELQRELGQIAQLRKELSGKIYRNQKVLDGLCVRASDILYTTLGAEDAVALLGDRSSRIETRQQ